MHDHTAVSESTVAAAVVDFVRRSYPGDDPGITRGTRLLEEGLIDSLGLLDLVAFVEESYGIFVDDVEVDLDNFGSPGAVAAFVVSKANGR